MLISKAYAQAVEIGEEVMVQGGDTVMAPSPMQSFAYNMGLVLVLVVLFYILLIRPQQKRFREHSEMLSGLKKGDRVVTGGGLVGTIEKIEEGNSEVVVNLGNGLKVTAVRNTLQGMSSPLMKEQPAKKK
ncbi:MAG: preprotein translocase subunit YajC [Alphaproteobacteria bacterium]|nr:preprotein translocase subunit YajC [Alphaproteobacteria bacterium]